MAFDRSFQNIAARCIDRAVTAGELEAQLTPSPVDVLDATFREALPWALDQLFARGLVTRTYSAKKGANEYATTLVLAVAAQALGPSVRDAYLAAERS